MYMSVNIMLSKFILFIVIFIISLLVPSLNRKTISGYVDSLFNLELERGGFPAQKNPAPSHVETNTTNNENKQKYVHFFICY